MIIWLGMRQALQKIASAHLTLEIGADVVQPATVVRGLGVLVDQELTLKQHVTKVASSCFYQLRRLKQVHRYVDNNVMAQLVAAFVTSQLAFHNQRLLHSNDCKMPQKERLVLGIRPYNHTMAALHQLHWLPVAYHVQYKLCILMHSIVNGMPPVYL